MQIKMTDDLALIFSLFTLGFFNGFSHCALMCGPFVLTQVSNNLQKIPLQNFSAFKKLKSLALLPYQLGRISTYSLIGFFCSLLTKNIEDFFHFRIFSAALLLFAGLFFFNLAFDKKLLPFKSLLLKKPADFFAKKISFLFRNPTGFTGYILGLILGFIPCGLLYGAFLIAAAISNPFLAAIGMVFFGLATFPALFLTASNRSYFTKNFCI